MKPTILVLIFLLTSCHTYKWAEKGINKRDQKFPEIIASICSSRYNPIDSIKEITKYLPGEIIYKHDSIRVNCDSLKQLNPNKPLTVKLPCPPSVLKTDTFKKEIFITTSNKAEIFLLNKSKDSLKNIVVTTENRLIQIQDKLTKRNSQLTKAVIGLLLLLAFICIIVYKKIII